MKGKGPAWTRKCWGQLFIFLPVLWLQHEVHSTLLFSNKSFNNSVSLQCIFFCSKLQCFLKMQSYTNGFKKKCIHNRKKKKKRQKTVLWQCIFVWLPMQTCGRVVWTSLAVERALHSAYPSSGNATERRTVTTEKMRSTVVSGKNPLCHADNVCPHDFQLQF